MTQDLHVRFRKEKCYTLPQVICNMYSNRKTHEKQKPPTLATAGNKKGTKNTERKTKQQQFYSEVLSNYNFTEMNTTIQ
jgi:hypothetical protein